MLKSIVGSALPSGRGISCPRARDSGFGYIGYNMISVRMVYLLMFFSFSDGFSFVSSCFGSLFRPRLFESYTRFAVIKNLANPSFDLHNSLSTVDGPSSITQPPSTDRCWNSVWIWVAYRPPCSTGSGVATYICISECLISRCVISCVRGCVPCKIYAVALRWSIGLLRGGLYSVVFGVSLWEESLSGT